MPQDNLAAMDQQTETFPAPAEMPRKRRQVLEAARELFMAQGYEKTSMDAVARAALVSKATLYAHFPSKDVLFATIVGDACQRNTLHDEIFPANPPDIRAALLHIGARSLRFLLQEQTQAIFRVAVAEARRFPEMGRAFMENGPGAYSARFTAWLAEQSAARRLHAPRPDLAAEHFIALVRSGLFLRSVLGLDPAPDDATIQATVEAAVETFLKAFGPDHSNVGQPPLP